MNTKLQKNDVICAVYQRRQATIPELSRAMRLTVPTITKTVEQLLNDQTLLPVGRASSTGGRCAMRYALNGSRFFFVVVCVERFAMRLAIANIANELVTPVTTVNIGIANADEMLKLLQANVRNLINRSGINRNLIKGIGVAIPGLIDKNTGVSYSYFEGANMSMTKLFSKMFPYPVSVRHDMEVMTLAEYTMGAKKGTDNMLYFNIGAGVGLGIVIDGKLYLGNGGLVGEIGHIPLIDNNKLCYCGKTGCLETEVSETAIIDRVLTSIQNGVPTTLSRYVQHHPYRLTLQHILQALQEGDAFTISLFEQLAEPLGKAITIAMHLFNPQVVVLGGELSAARQFLLQPILQQLNRYAMPQLLNGCQVVTSSLGEQAPLLGNVASLVEDIFVSNSKLRR
ncbi:MAG: ROK family protein [Prevotellaceae bacterium]|nr:ROK family protein [Prevotellaceae bacterium]